MIIGLTGKKRSGKDTCANYIESLCDEQNRYCHKIAFADYLKFTLSINWQNYNGVNLSYKDFDGHGIDREFKLDMTQDQFEDYMLRCVAHLKRNGLKGDTPKIPVINNNEFTIRKFLQTLGTDIVVSMDKMYWVDIVFNYINKRIPKSHTIVITDCRQIHEIEAIRSHNGKVIHIKKNTNTNDNHITEQDLQILEGDIVIENNSSLEDFYKKVKNEYSKL